MQRRLIATFLVLVGTAHGWAQALEGEALFFTPHGFKEEGKAITAAGAGTGQLAIEVRDAGTGKIAPCRINVVGADGNFYQPPENHLTKYNLTGIWPKEGAWGNRPGKAPYRYLGRYFYSTGQTRLAVPAGKFRIEVWKGFEYQPQTMDVTVSKNETAEAALQLTRTVPMAQHGYYGGDLHLHFSRSTEREDETLFDLLDAEDVWFGTPLGYNEPAGPYTGIMSKMDSPQLLSLGIDSIRTRGHVSMLSGQEYRSAHFGHLNLYLLPKLVFEGQSFNLDDGPAYGIVGTDALARGGYAIHAHGGYAKEIYADAALGSVSAVELLQFGIYRELGLSGWYDMLNSGYRFPIVGASDFPACRFMSDCRTYAYSTTENPAQDAKSSDPESGKSKLKIPSFQEWLHAAADGKSFVTTGPLLLLEVDGERPGTVLRHDGDGPRNVTVRVRVRSEVTPVTNLDVIVNGEVVKQETISSEKRLGTWVEWTHTLALEKSSWIAARAWSTTSGGQPNAEAHTNPIYIDLHGRRAYSQPSIDNWIAKIDGQITLHTARAFKSKADVLAYFQKARDVLLRIRQQKGLKSEDSISRLSAVERKESSLMQEGASSLDSQIGRPDVTDDELRKFLKPVPPMSAAEALATFEVIPGFHVELVAGEPLVVDPVAAAFDENGQLYVCEMRDYPFKPTEGKEPIGTIRLLRDTDGDGTFDEGHVFADKLLWAAGVVPWKGGVFVAAAPDIWYLKDTNGDHKADVRRRVFSGFGTGNQQAMVNNLQFGFDQWIYGTTAGNGGIVQHVDQPSNPISLTGRDFRFDPVSERLEPITGTVQFGNTFDDWGNRFTCSESQPLSHIVQPDHYLARNPFLAAPGGIQNIAPGPVPIYRISPVERWRQIRSMRRIAKNERPATSPGASHHVIDAAAGVTVYRGGAYPQEFLGQVFIGDGQNNLVHRRALTPSAVTFQSKRIDEGTEFVRSSDIWFRPVNFVNAPDGTLYCLDMCREVLESIHIPLDVVKHLDLASGREQGRIYRIAPDGFHSPPPPRLGIATSSELVQQLESRHGWWRDTAQRLLCERQDKSVVPALRQLIAKSPLPQGRLQALWTLHGLKSLDDESLIAALRDLHPRVREHAVRLSEPRLDVEPKILELVLALADDPDARIRYQVAFSLGETKDPRAAQVLAALARRDATNPWMRTAVLSSAYPFAADLFSELARTPEHATFLNSLAGLIGMKQQPDEIRRTVEVLAGKSSSKTSSTIDPLLVELGRGLRQVGGFLTPQSGAERYLEKQFALARQIAIDPQSKLDQRVLATELLGCSSTENGHDILLGLISNEQPEALQIAALRAVGNAGEPRTVNHLLSAWRSLSPDVRRVALDLLWSRDDWARELLQAAAGAEISLADVEPVRRDRLLQHRNEDIQRLAKQVFDGITPAARQSVLKDYQRVLKMAGTAKNGQAVFEKQCASCHQLQGKGHAVGPNLASSPSRDPQALLTHILDPNQYVLPNFVQYVVTDRQGRNFTGLLASQTATSLTLKRDQGLSTTILRTEIEDITSTGKSLMPEELEKVISYQAMADLLEFLQDSVKKSAGESVAERDIGTLPGLIEPQNSEPPEQDPG